MDQGIHPDHSAIDVTQRTATVPGIDRRIRLDVILIFVRQQFIAAFSTHHAGREGVGEFVRSSDRTDDLTYFHLIAVCEIDRREDGGVDFYNCHIGSLIRADDFGRRKFARLSA